MTTISRRLLSAYHNQRLRWRVRRELRDLPPGTQQRGVLLGRDLNMLDLLIQMARGSGQIQDAIPQAHITMVYSNLLGR